MATDAQRLISISLTKIAQSRSQRGGASLHRNLLVATVLQKARYLFMEEAYQIVHGRQSYVSPPPAPQVEDPLPEQIDYEEEDEEGLVGVTAEEAGSETDPSRLESGEERIKLSCAECYPDRENRRPFALCANILDRSRCGGSRKRRGPEPEEDTSEVKKCRSDSNERIGDDLDDLPIDLTDSEKASLLAGMATATEEDDDEGEVEDAGQTAMEIDRITSLVSIFSFETGFPNLPRSVSTPDLCSAQAKEHLSSDSSRAFLTMTA